MSAIAEPVRPAPSAAPSAQPAAPALLELRNVSLSFGGVKAIKFISIIGISGTQFVPNRCCLISDIERGQA